MSLLTDAKLQAIFQEHHNVLAAPGTVMFDDWRRIIAAQQTETLKAAAEWQGGFCINEKHHKQASRMYCPPCMVEFYHAACKGKMPGEE